MKEFDEIIEKYDEKNQGKNQEIDPERENAQKARDEIQLQITSLDGKMFKIVAAKTRILKEIDEMHKNTDGLNFEVLS